MKINEKWLKEKEACFEGVKWFLSQKESDGVKVLEALISDDKLDWGSWTIVRIMERKQYLAYAIYAAEQVLDIFEKKYPRDKRPRVAIEAAKTVLNKNSEKNIAVAHAAAYAADDAGYAAHAAHAALAVAGAALAAADAAHAAADADDAAHAAAHAAHAALAVDKKKMRIKILKYGIGLLKEGEGA